MTLAPRSQRGSTLKGKYRTISRFQKTQGVKKMVNDVMACLGERAY